MTNLTGRSLGRYHILEQLGEGGMATVYKAYDTRLERDVAVKIIRTDMFIPNTLQRVLQRFEREAKLLAKLSHPNIVGVLDFGEYEGSPYLVLEYLSGGTLKEYMQAGPLPWEEAIRLLIPIADALSYAHEHGMVHRDIKPSNILLTDKNRSMLSDFGIAKILESEETLTSLTATGMGVGTPEYMAPEQWTGETVPQSDIYSLGVVLYEMLTGRKPYMADTPAAILLKQANEPLPRPRQFSPDLPDKLEKLLLKALAKDPENRFQNMGEFGHAMERLLQVAKDVKKAPKKVKEKTAKEEHAKISRVKESKWKLNTVIKWGAIAGVLILTVVLLISLKFTPATPSPAPSFSVTTTKTNLPTTVPSSTFIPAETQVGLSIESVITPEASSIPKNIITTEASATSEPEIGSSWTRPSDDMVMLYVPKGNFQMGSLDADSKADYDEKPRHTVYLDSFWIDQTEVTNTMYTKCVQAGVCRAPQDIGPSGVAGYYSSSQYAQYPVLNVSWDDAQKYCKWTGGRLPSEAEWEKAARGIDGRTFPWGEGYDCSLAQYYPCGSVNSKSVGSFPSGASPYGALDMAGNVYEWVADWYSSDYYSLSPQSNPLGPDSGTYKVYRGGGYQFWASSSRAAKRFYDSLDTRNLIIGFRCASDATP